MTTSLRRVDAARIAREATLDVRQRTYAVYAFDQMCSRLPSP